MIAPIEGYRRLADFLDAHPEFVSEDIHFTTSHKDLGIHLYMEDKKAGVKALTRALHGSWSKDVSGSGTTMYIEQKDVFGYFAATIFVDRDAVCERKLVRTDQVEIPAVEAAPARIADVPVYEWECKSIFAEEPAVA